MPCDGRCLHNSCTGLRHPSALASEASAQRGNTNAPRLFPRFAA